MTNHPWIRTRLKILFVLFVSLLLMLLLFASPGFTALYGDLNNDGKINVQDVALVMRHVLDVESLDEDELLFADVNGDGVVNVQDAALIMQKSLQLIDNFPDLPDARPGLIKDFIVAEGLSPGKKMVIVLLDVDDPQEYDGKVTIADITLGYSDAVGGFVGEVDEEDAERHKIKVEEAG